MQSIDVEKIMSEIRSEIKEKGIKISEEIIENIKNDSKKIK